MVEIRPLVYVKYSILFRSIIEVKVFSCLEAGKAKAVRCKNLKENIDEIAESQVVIMLNCPNCGKDVSNQDAVFCPYCSKPLNVTRKRSGFPIAAGILTLIASCIAVIIGFIALFSDSTAFVVTGVFCFLAFAFGLTGGILTLKRRIFPLAIIGVIFVLVSGLVIISAFATAGYDYDLSGSGVLIGIPIIILSILGIIFTAISKGEFA
jgi:hypothetical protein